MTKKRKTIILCCFISLIIICLVYFVFISDIPLSITYTECANYDDFDRVQDDFERIAEIASEYGDSIYYLETNGLSKLDYPKITELQIAEADQGSIKHIQMYCSDNTTRRLSHIVVKKDNIEFEYDAIGCGIVKTTDIKSFIKSLSTNKEYGYTKLAENWYAYYR